MTDATQLAVLASRFQQLLQKILEKVEKSRRSKRIRRVLKSTLRDLNPLVQEIVEYNDDLDRPREEIKALIKENGAGGDGARKCFPCALLWEKCLYWVLSSRDRLWHRRNNSFDADDKQALKADMKDTLYKVRELLELLSRDNFEKRLNFGPVKRPCGVPEYPWFTVGLDEPLRKLKTEVLRDGMSHLVLTGLGGSGKTTVAAKLCCDEQVMDKFKENILFVTFSKTPKTKIIVERIFEHCGYKVPEFQSNEDAVNRMVILLRHIGRSPLLLVLDDVWPGSEALIEKFKIQMSDYKVLVTSRVAFPKFGIPCVLKPLYHEDATTLFRHVALLEESCAYIPNKDIVQKVVGGCKGSPLAIVVTGRSLSGKPYDFWLKMVEKLSQGHSILDSNAELLNCLKKILDVLEDKPIIKKCFMDLGLFPEDQRIPVTTLFDIWTELYGLDDDGLEAMTIIKILDSMNLANVLVARKNACDDDSYYYNNHSIIQHDLLRELAIYESSQEPIEHRQRLTIDINESAIKLWIGEKQKGMIARIFSKFLRWNIRQKPLKISASTLSVSIDEACPSCWPNIQTDEAEVLILNLRTKQYSFPEPMEKMSKLKVVIVTNYGFHPSELNNFQLLSSLCNLKRMRLERISLPSFGTLKNMKKLSLYMCNTIQAFKNGNILISEALPNLVELNVDYCKDMVELPNGVCNITPLKKLGITNCHKLSALPKEIGNLINLEQLNLSCCTDLEGLPDSIGRLSNLRLLDISNCISLPSLPEEIGDLSNLRSLYMTSCANCELPFSVTNLENLKVICDEETAASWEAFIPLLPNLKIEVPQVDVNLNWLHPISS